MRYSVGAALLFVVLLAGPVQAGTFGMGFNDNSFGISLKQVLSRDGRGASNLRVKGIYDEPENTRLAAAGIDVDGRVPAVPGLSIGAGARGYYVAADRDDISAGGLGISGQYAVPGVPNLKLGATFYYCPKVFNFLDGVRLQDFSGRLIYQLASRAAVFAGYSNVRASIITRGKQSLDESVRCGIILSF